VAFLVAPFQAVTGIEDFNQRFLLPAFILMLASLASNRPRRLPEGTRWALTLVTTAAAIIVLAFQYSYVGRIAHKLQSVYDVISQAHLSPDFRDLGENEFEHLERLAPLGSASPRLLPMHESLGYFAEYFRLDEQTCIPIFSRPTSIIGTSTVYHPLLSDLKQLTEFPSTITIFGLQTRNRKIATLMADQYETITDTEYVLILQRKAVLASPGQR
jgi:hypothetical protein